MRWADVHDTFLEAADALPELVAQIDDFSVPALGDWNLRELCGHLLRAVKAPVLALADDEPGGGPKSGGAAAYFAAYLEWREANPEVDAEVAERARGEVHGIDDHELPRLFREACAAARAALVGIHGDRKVPTRFGTFAIGDYLRTRTLEITVHAIDVARAAGLDWEPPETPLADTLHLLTDIARHRDRGASLVMALTGRPGGDDALPILR